MTNSWGTAVRIETNNTGNAINPQIAIDTNGNALVVWATSTDSKTGNSYNIIASRFDVGMNSWGTAVLVETGSTGTNTAPQIDIDSNGNALAVWVTNNNIKANRFDASTNTWGTAVLIETYDTIIGGANNPQIAIDNNGNALVVWSQYDGSLNSIFANRFDASTNSWGKEVMIETDNINANYNPQIAIDSNGNAMAVWDHNGGGAGTSSIFANRFDASTNSWDTEILIETDNNGDAVNPQLAIDNNGNALAVWSQYDDKTRVDKITSNRFNASTNSWGTAMLVETGSNGDSFNPQIAIDSKGNALAVWRQYDGITTGLDLINANRFE